MAPAPIDSHSRMEFGPDPAGQSEKVLCSSEARNSSRDLQVVDHLLVMPAVAPDDQPARIVLQEVEDPGPRLGQVMVVRPRADEGKQMRPWQRVMVGARLGQGLRHLHRIQREGMEPD